MHFLGKFRVVRFEPGSFRLEKSDPFRLLHLLALLAVLAFVPLAAVLPSDWLPASAVPSLALLVFGLIELARRGSKGVNTRVTRSIALESSPGDYRGPPERWLVLDGRRIPMRDVRQLRVFTTDQHGRAPDGHTLYLATRGEAFRLESSPDRAMIDHFARTLADALQIAPPEPELTYEPISKGAVALVFGYLLVEMATTVLLAVLPPNVLIQSSEPRVGLVAGLVALRLVTHAIFVYGLSGAMLRDERRRAATMFGPAITG